MMDERLGKLQFWMTFIGFHGTFLIQHWLGNEGMAAPLRRLPADRRLHDAEHDLDDLLVRPRRLDDPVRLQRREVVEVRAARAARRPLGSRQLAGVGDRRPRRRGTTSSRSRGSARSARRSRRTTRTCSSGCRPRRTRASGTSPTPASWASRHRSSPGPERPRPDLIAPTEARPQVWALQSDPGRCRPRPARTPCRCSPPRSRPAALTVSGVRRHRLFSALAGVADGGPSIEVLDVEQVVVHGQLVLGVVVGALPDGDGAVVPTRPSCWPACRGSATTWPRRPASRCGSSRPRTPSRSPVPAGRPHHVIVLGRPVPPDAVAGAARAIAGIGGNIDAIRRLSDYPVTSFELTVSGAEATALRTGARARSRRPPARTSRWSRSGSPGAASG